MSSYNASTTVQARAAAAVEVTARRLLSLRCVAAPGRNSTHRGCCAALLSFLVNIMKSDPLSTSGGNIFGLTFQ